jgi:glycosyltransferase involved in cell wall biosynthesis
MLFISNYQKVLALVAGSSHLRAHFLGKRAVFAFLMSQGTGIPFSAVAHAEDLFSWTSSVRIIIKHALLIHVISNYNIGYLNAKTSFRFSDKLQLIRNSFYRQERDQNQSLEVSGLSHARNVDVVDGVRPVRFFMASRLVANKGIIEWIEVLSEFKKLRMFEMMIAGDGPIKEQICQRIDELSLRREISLLGVIPSKAVHENIANCDFAVIFSMNASLTWPHMDGLPTFFFEALSAGVPVISTFVSGIPEIVLHGFNGILLSPNSSPRQNALILNRQIQNGKFDRCRIREHFYDYLNELEGGEVLYGCLSNMHTAAGDNSSGFSP